MFLISTFVPNASLPTGRSETFASQRSDPSSILHVARRRATASVARSSRR